MVDYERLGWSRYSAAPPAAGVVRVRAQHRIAWDVLGPTGAMRVYARRDLAPRPVVGDWLAVEGDRIVEVLARKSELRRRAAGSSVKSQVLAANVDTTFLVMAVDVDWNLRRLERLLVLTREGGSAPVVVLSKADCTDEQEDLLAQARSIAGNAPVHCVAAATGIGLEALYPYLAGHATVALLGSSGVGKSTLANALLGASPQRVSHTRRDGKGRHTTTGRDLLLHPTEGLLIDTPGLREVGLIDAEEGLEEAFADIAALAQHCRFRDCTHGQEPNCAVTTAIDEGRLDRTRVLQWKALIADEGARR